MDEILNALNILASNGGIISFNDAWPLIERVINNWLATGNKTNKYHIPTYTLIYRMCTQRRPNNHSRQVYDAQREWMTNYIQGTIIPPMKEEEIRGQGSGSELLEVSQRSWKRLKLVRHIFRNCFGYLDRMYVKHHTLPNIGESAIQIFRTSIGEAFLKKVKEAIVSAVVQFIDEKRRVQGGSSIDTKIVAQNVKMLNEMEGLFIHDLIGMKHEMVKSIVKYYAETWIREENEVDSTSIGEFVLLTKDKVNEDVTMFFDDSTEPMVQDIVTSEYILEELILQGLTHERNGGAAEAVRSKFRNVFDIYDQMEKLNESRLRSRVIEISREYYAELRSRWSVEKSVVQYIGDIEEILEDESGRILFYIREEEWATQAIEAAKQELAMNFAATFIEGKIRNIGGN